MQIFNRVLISVTIKQQKGEVNALSNAWKVYLLALVTFLVGTSEYVISGILDKISDTMGISVTSAGQLVMIFSFVYTGKYLGGEFLRGIRLQGSVVPRSSRSIYLYMWTGTSRI